MSSDDVSKILAQFDSRWPEEISIEWGDDNGRYVNLLVDSVEPQATWDRAKGPMLGPKLPGAEFRRAMIVTATGTSGWDDYLLLHHYDGDEQIDILPESAG